MGKEGDSSAKEIIIKFSGSEILERTAAKFGTGAHVIIPKEYAGKNIKIILEEIHYAKNKLEKGGKS